MTAQSLHLQYLPFPFTTHSPVITWSHLWQRPLSEMISCFMRNINCSPTVVSISTSLPTEIGGPSTRGHKWSCSINWWNWLCTMCAIELIDLKRIKDKNSKYLLTYFKHYYSNNTNHICYESQRFQKKHKLLYRVVFLTGPPQKMTKCQFTY